MTARIFKPAKTAMQSGPARTLEWMLEYEPETPRAIEPLMGWTSSSDMKSQIRLEFATKEEAVAYAERNGIPYRVLEPTPRRHIRKAYADNFKFGRIGSWTH
jgi:hypothetical protein